MSFDDDFRVNPFHSLLYSTPVSRIVRSKRTLITLNADDSVQTSFSHLANSRIIGAPIFDREGVCVGSVDVLDMISYLCSKAPPEQLTIRDLMECKLDTIPVKTLVASGRNSLVPFFQDNPASMLVDLFANSVPLVRRVAVFDRSYQLLTTCSHLDVISFVLQSVEDQPELAALLDASIASHNIVRRPAKTIRCDFSVLDGASKLLRENIMGLAVVDTDGKLMANFSAPDMRGLYIQDFPFFFSRIDAFLQNHSPKSLEPACGTLEMTVREAMQQMIERRIHRIFIVDENNVPTGVVSVTDIMKFLSSGDKVSLQQASGDADIRRLWRS